MYTNDDIIFVYWWGYFFTIMLICMCNVMLTYCCTMVMMMYFYTVMIIYLCTLMVMRHLCIAMIMHFCTYDDNIYLYCDDDVFCTVMIIYIVAVLMRYFCNMTIIYLCIVMMMYFCTMMITYPYTVYVYPTGWYVVKSRCGNDLVLQTWIQLWK